MILWCSFSIDWSSKVLIAGDTTDMKNFYFTVCKTFGKKEFFHVFLMRIYKYAYIYIFCCSIHKLLLFTLHQSLVWHSLLHATIAWPWSPKNLPVEKTKDHLYINKKLYFNDHPPSLAFAAASKLKMPASKNPWNRWNTPKTSIPQIRQNSSQTCCLRMVHLGIKYVDFSLCMSSKCACRNNTNVHIYIRLMFHSHIMCCCQTKDEFHSFNPKCNSQTVLYGNMPRNYGKKQSENSSTKSNHKTAQVSSIE